MQQGVFMFRNQTLSSEESLEGLIDMHLRSGTGSNVQPGQEGICALCPCLVVSPLQMQNSSLHARASFAHVEKVYARFSVRLSKASHSALWPGSGMIAPNSMALLGGIAVTEIQSRSSDRLVTCLNRDHRSFSNCVLVSVLRPPNDTHDVGVDGRLAA